MYTYIPISPPSCISLPPTLPIPPLEVVTEHQADLPVLCSCFPLAISFTFGSVYMSMLLSHFVLAYLSPAPCPQVHSIHLRLFFFLTSLLEYNCFKWCVSFCFITNLISYTYTYIPICPPSCVSLPPSLSHPSRWSQSTKLISLCYAAASH